MTEPDPDPALPELLAGWLPRQRWFAGKGRPIARVQVAQSAPLRTGEPSGDLMVLTVSYHDGGPSEHYQLLLGRRAELPVELEHVAIGAVPGGTAYDGLWDHELSTHLLDELADGAQRDGVHFVPEPDAVIPRGKVGRMLGVEQSNSSVAYGEDCILKLYRRVAPGINPDLELHRALRAVGSEHVAQLRAAIEGTIDGQPATLAMLQDFASNSADGWAMALISVRDLFAEGDLHASEVGGDFAGEARRLGQAVAEVHADLARALGGGEQQPGEIAQAMTRRLEAAVDSVPALAAPAPAIIATFTELAQRSTPVPVQRIHGDLHLGQALRTTSGWLLIDFEGEPARALVERVRPDSPLRDVAAMLRSFDYAALRQLAEWEDPEEQDPQLSRRSLEWARRNRAAFCDGYAKAADADPRDDEVLLRAYELDKAVYEAVYEARNRPDWLPIPLESITRLTAG